MVYHRWICKYGNCNKRNYPKDDECSDTHTLSSYDGHDEPDGVVHGKYDASEGYHEETSHHAFGERVHGSISIATV